MYEDSGRAVGTIPEILKDRILTPAEWRQFSQSHPLGTSDFLSIEVLQKNFDICINTRRILYRELRAELQV
jgi:hypothetical protein